MPYPIRTLFPSRAWWALVLLLAAVPCVAADPVCASVQESAGTFCLPGRNPLPYRMAVIGAELPGRYDLVLFLHGAGERGDDNRQHLVFGYKPLTRFCSGNRIKAVLLFPQCPRFDQWSSIRIPEIDPPLTPEPTAPLASAVALLCEKKGEFPIRNTYAVGISMGGYGVWDLLIRHTDLFSAGMAICGGGDVQQAARLVKMPLFVAHGCNDILVPTERSRHMVNAIWNAGGKKVVYQEHPRAAHDVWNTVFADDATWEWLFRTKSRSPGLPRRLRHRLLPLPKILPWQSRLF